MLEPSNSQATCRLTQDAQSRAGSNPVHHSASLQEAEPTQQESQQQLQQLSQQDLAVHNQQQQGQQLEHQHQQLQYTKPTEMQQHQQSLSSDSLLNSKRDQQAGSPAACKLEDQPKQAMESPPDNTCTSLAPTALKGNMVDIQAEVIIPDLHPDDMVVANRTIPAQLPAPDLPALQVQQDLTSSDTAGEAATAATSCISSASASLQHSAAASNSGSETDVSVVPDSQVMNEDDWAPAPAAEQPHSQLVTGHGGTQQQQIAEDGYSHAFWASADFSSEDRACSSSEPLYTASPSAVAAESPSRQQQAAGFATERPAVTELTTASSVTEMPTAGSDVRQTTPSSEIKQTLASVSAEQSTVCSVSRQTAAACQQASSSHMPDVTEQHLPQPQQLQHVQSQSASSSSCVSPSTTCATSALVIDDSDSDSDFQTAQPFRFMSDRQANQHQAAAAAPLGDAPFTDPTASKQAALQPSTANLQCRQQQSGKTGIHALKLMLRAPRGTTVKQAHSLSSLKGVRFAELLQVNHKLPCTGAHLHACLQNCSAHHSLTCSLTCSIVYDSCTQMVCRLASFHIHQLHTVLPIDVRLQDECHVFMRILAASAG